jgi:DNA-binding LacI/PurR family transcriptional regulator
MPQLNRVLLLDQAIAHLRGEIASGRLRGHLPGVRLLGTSLGVSPPTVSAAVRHLVAEGVLIHEGARKRLRIAAPDGIGDRPRSAHRKVLFLTPTSLADIMPVALEILSRLLIARPQWNIRQFAVAAAGGNPSRRQWDALIKTEQPDQVLVFSGRPEQARWAAARETPVIFLGGDPGQVRIPILGLRAADMLTVALDRLLDLGHRRICLPFCGQAPGFVERQREFFAAKLAERDVPFVPSYHAPVAKEDNPAALESLVRGVFKLRAPTALLALDWNHLLFLMSYAARRGLRVPEQLSMVLLSEDRNLPWLTPRPAHFRYPIHHLVKVLIRWIENGPPSPDATMALDVTFDPAEGLAAASD